MNLKYFPHSGSRGRVIALAPWGYLREMLGTHADLNTREFHQET